MKTKITITFYILISFTTIWAQSSWTGGTGILYTMNGTKVGIGLNNPTVGLQINGNNYNSSTLSLERTDGWGSTLFLKNLYGSTASGKTLGALFFNSSYTVANSNPTQIENYPGAGIIATSTETWSATGGGTKLEFRTASNGTSTLATRFSIEQDGSLNAFGNTFIGTTSQGKNLTVKGSTISKQYFVSDPLGQWQMGLYAKAAHAQAKLINLKNSADADIFNVWGNGNVNVKLLFAEEIRVTANAMNEWWDKVFLPEYNLQSLSDVEAFVKANHRLPDLPSENEVKTQGYNLQQMDGLLLKKIEELTLYIIELQKQVETLKNK